VREGLIPTVLGTAVTAASAAAKTREVRNNNVSKSDLMTNITAGVVGFGLAHIVLGSIDLVRKRR